MKTAKPLSSDLSSSRRAQPIRQTRTNPPRSSGTLARSFGAKDSLGGGLSNGQGLEQQTDIFPAITYFADVITALPKELVRHFTLLKEVDAKIFAPEEALGQLVDAALNTPLPLRRNQLQLRHTTETIQTHAGVPATINGSIINSKVVAAADALDPYDQVDSAWDHADVPRRQLFRQCTYTMQEMLISLDEKNHVLCTAAEALNKQLSRLDNCFPYIEEEISEETRYGNEKHWAYTESRTSKPTDRPRRDAGSANQAANSYQVSVDEAAARSELRKQAMLAKKGRTHQAESDFDDHLDARHKGDSGKKPHNKKGRPTESTSIGLGITNGTVVNGNPPSKRRKVEKGPIGGAIMERSLSTILGSNGVAPKGKVSSPGDTPASDASKKKPKSASTTTNGHVRKKTAANTNAMSPSLASSPTHNNFSDVKGAQRTSPPPTNGGRPAATKGRQNSTQSVAESARQRPSSSTSNKPNGNAAGPPDLDNMATVTGRPPSDIKTSKDSLVNMKGENTTESVEQQDTDTRGTVIISNRKEGTLKREDTEPNGDALPLPPPPAVTTTITMTKSGRASKPSTPAIPSFPEPIRSRSSRNSLEQTITNKRSHKKGAGQAAQLLAAQTAAVEDDTTSSMQEDEEDMEIDANEPRYCYCNGVSYGEMVACDADGCAKEWFHLDCVGLKVAPKGNAKWYCDDCKENMKNNKRFSGR